VKRLRHLWLFSGLTLTIALLLTACGGPATPAVQPATVPIITRFPTTSATPAPATDTPAPEVPPPTSSATTLPATAAPTATATASPVAILLECESGPAWSETREGVTLAMCFDPRPPQLGIPVNFEAMITDATGQQVTDATVELVLVGGMEGMAGEHDEDFAVQLDNQGSGRYAAQDTVRPSDLVLTAMRISVRSGSQSWSFSASETDLRLP